jgi:hypothetical protein
MSQYSIKYTKAKQNLVFTVYSYVYRIYQKIIKE